MKVSGGDSMGTFTWLGGDIGNGNNWSSGGSTGTELGPNDDAVLANGGHVWAGECRPGRIHGGLRPFRRQSAGWRRSAVFRGQHHSERRHRCHRQRRALIGFAWRNLHAFRWHAERAAGHRVRVGHVQAIQRHQPDRRDRDGGRRLHIDQWRARRRQRRGAKRPRIRRPRQQRRLRPERRHAHGRASAGNRLWRQR